MRRTPSSHCVLGGLVLAALAVLPGPGAATPRSVASPQSTDLATLQAGAVERLQEYIRIDTVNPPGNESRGVEFFAAILDAEGIPYETAESAPGRGNIWARLEGGDEPGLLLLHHMDVVPADEEHWSVDPLAGEIRDGWIYGRGAVDDKSSGILHLQAFLALHRSGRELRRDIVFMATADEEAGGFYGAGWLAENRPELFEDVGFILNEGGEIGVEGERHSIEVEVTQKVPLWLRLVAEDEPGHGSMPRVTSAVTRLVRALDNLRTHEFEPRIVPAVDTYFKALAGRASEVFGEPFGSMSEAVRDPAFLLRLQLEDPALHALTRNTCSITMLEGSTKINVVPPDAAAQVDCRLLPDQDPDAFIETMSAVINDPAVRIERIMGFTPAVSSTDTELFRAIETVGRRHFPDAAVVPAVSTGFTDSHFFRDMGIVAYGFDPVVLPPSELIRIHGNDERISVENVERGVQMMLEIVEEMVDG